MEIYIGRNVGAIGRRMLHACSGRFAAPRQALLTVQGQVDHGTGSTVGTTGRARGRREVGALLRKGQGLGSTRSARKWPKKKCKDMQVDIEHATEDGEGVV